MKIKVTAPLKSGEIQSFLDGYSCEDGVEIQFIEKIGTMLIFDVVGVDDAEKAVSMIKSLIKGTEFGKVLYFSVAPA